MPLTIPVTHPSAPMALTLEPCDAARQHWITWLPHSRALTQNQTDWGRSVRDGFSDIRFADANRVPFPFARTMREKFDLTTVVTASDGPRRCDLDGQWSLDVSGSYGVNVAGFERYKDWIQRGWDRVKALGPVLGPVHPIVADNIRMLRSISGLDEVSFHMSGTEAVMAAVRLVRFNTGRRLIVCFSGAYHGWWDGVVAGLGSERRLDDCLTLKDLDPRSLAVIRRRAHEIAAVLVNPVQSFHPNTPPPNATHDYMALQHALVGATTRMKRDGWWLDATEYPQKEQRMKSRLVQEMLSSLVPPPFKAFHEEVMLRKKDDHHASHNDFGNQMLHLVSSSVFLYCYAILAFDLTSAMCLGLAALFIRQFGHAVLEPDARGRR